MSHNDSPPRRLVHQWCGLPIGECRCDEQQRQLRADAERGRLRDAEGVVLQLNKGELAALRFLLDDCKLIWPDPIKQPQARAIQQIADRLDATIADQGVQE